MKHLFVSFLRNSPPIFNIVIQIYYFIQPIHIKELVLGSRARDKDWETKTLHKGNDWGGKSTDWIDSYWESRNHSHRKFLVNRISTYKPESILEIGCNCAPNLYLLAKKFPDIEITGIDINPMVIDRGLDYLHSEKVYNVRLQVYNLKELAKCPSKYFDVVFTDSVLIYVHPKEIRETIKQMIRIAKRSVIMLERYDTNLLGVYRYGCWERDYVGILKQFINEKQISLTKITSNEWDEERWKKTGVLVEARLSDEKIPLS
jgi:SAM-dependent methyltransferase